MQTTIEPAALAVESILSSNAFLSEAIEEQKDFTTVPFRVSYLHSLQGLQEKTVITKIIIIKYFINLKVSTKDIIYYRKDYNYL